MKKLLLFLLLPCALNAQTAHTYLCTDAGTSLHYQKVALYIGEQFQNNIIVEGGMSVNLDRNVYHPNFFGINTGYILNNNGDFKYTPLAGIFYRMQSSDIPSLNGYSALFGVRVNYKCFYIESDYIHKNPVICIGLKAFFNE